MGRYQLDKGCWVVNKDGQQFIYSPSGEELWGVQWTDVYDHVDSVPKCIVSMVVNIAESHEDMMNKIKEFAEEREEMKKKWKTG